MSKYTCMYVTYDKLLKKMTTVEKSDGLRTTELDDV